MVLSLPSVYITRLVEAYNDATHLAPIIQLYCIEHERNDESTMTSQTESHTRLHDRRLLIARLAWLLFTLTCILSALSFVFLALSWATPVPDTYGFRGDMVIVALTFGSIGLLLARRHPENPIGWLLLAAGLVTAIVESCSAYATYALLTEPGALPFGILAAWVGSWLWIIAIDMLLYAFLLFPTGHLPSARWRPVAWFVVSAFALMAFAFMIRPGPLYFAPYRDNPFAVQVAYPMLSPIPVAHAGALLLIGIAVILRFRRAEGIERQQLKWFAYAATLRIIIGLTYSVANAAGLQGIDPKFYQYLTIATWIVIPFAIAIAILRYRLWDIDIIINRTLVYGTLTAGVVGLYVLTVGWLSMILQTQNYLLTNVFAIVMIAFLFQPLRQLLQGIADRFVPVPQSAPPFEPPEYQLTSPKGLGPADTTLRGRWLLVARLAWAAGFIALTIMYAFGFMEVHEALSTVCEEERCTLRQQIRHTEAGEQVMNWQGSPVGYADRLRPDQVEALETFSLTLDQYGWLAALQMGIPALVYLLIAARLFWRKSDDWMVLFVSTMVMTFPLVDMPLPYTLAVRQPVWGWVQAPANFVAFSCFFIFPLVFPNGRFVPRWTRWKVFFDIVFAVIATLWRSSILRGPPGADAFILVCVILSFSTDVYAQSYRYFRVASPVERQQIKWVFVGLVGFFTLAFSVLWPLDTLLIAQAGSIDPVPALVLSAILDTLFRAIALFMPVSIAISVLRYRLWDIDILISRTLVYGTLTAGIVALYILLVGALIVLSQTTGNLLISLLATGLIAFLFQPLRERLQRGVNRLLYGERDEPYVVLSKLGHRLETVLAPHAILSTIVETIGRTLKLPFVEIRLTHDQARSVSFGKHQATTIAFPLTYQNEAVGELDVAPRAGESLSSADHNLLKDLARQTGIAIHAARVTVDLQRSRERLVLAREEERRRLRRDLHDDLAPTLASLGLTASTAADLIQTNPTTATKLVKELQTEIRATVGNIRRLVYDLRPPTLDELGLLAAVRERAAQYSNAPDGFHVTVDAPAKLPALPAAVEVAAYRIVQEALENVSKHSKARQCAIRFANHKGLEIEIIDDGIGLPLNITPGVGLRSMRERVEELGGSCVIESGKNGGTHVLACLPIGEFDGTFAHPDLG
jgi:signal transduction histidine kinase